LQEFQTLSFFFEISLFGVQCFFIAMEGSEAYNAFKDIEVELNEVIEDNVFDNQDI
jgi:hypothetical protein